MIHTIHPEMTDEEIAIAMDQRSRGRIKLSLHERINARGYCQRCGYLFPVDMFAIYTHLPESQIDIAQNAYETNHWTKEAMKYNKNLKRFLTKNR